MFLLTAIGLLACDNGTSGEADQEEKPSNLHGTEVADTEENTETLHDTEVEDTDTGTAEEIPPGPTTAINLDFDDWDGGLDRFYLSKGDPEVFSDNITFTTVDEHKCLTVHAPALEHEGYGYAIELAFALDQPTDMSREDFTIWFDIYVPSITHEKGANIQYAFFETASWTPIYSAWWTDSLKPDEWVTLTAPVSITEGWITYADFENNPKDWIQLDEGRLQMIINGVDAAEGDEILFYIDNLIIDNFSQEE